MDFRERIAKSKKVPVWAIGVSSHLTVVAELIALLFTLVGADNELQIVSVEEILSDVGAPVAASPSHLVGYAAILGHWVTPKQVQNLGTDDNVSRELSRIKPGWGISEESTFTVSCSTDLNHQGAEPNEAVFKVVTVLKADSDLTEEGLMTQWIMVC